MSCNPWRWLWGLIPIAMLSWIAFNWERQNIEADLMQRAQAELARQDLGWAVPSFSGRDGIVRGRAVNESEPKQALNTVRSIWGVRVVEPRTDLLQRADVFSWLATWRKDKLVLSGFVPSEAARRSLLSVARVNFPRVELQDAMQLARGSPRQDVWLNGASFALRQLAKLSNGTTDLNDMSLSIAGQAGDGQSYKSVRSALARLPAGMKLNSERIIPAPVSPFLWSAQHSQGKLVLSGYVPSQAAREEIFARARSIFSDVVIVDRLEVASGAPDGWERAALSALEQMAWLDEASVELRGAQLSISGAARDRASAQGIRNALRGSVPATIKVSERITFPEPRQSVDYQARWREAEARWEAAEAKRPKPPAPIDDGGEAWWQVAQRQAESRLSGSGASQAKPPAGKRAMTGIRWGDFELVWGRKNDELQRQRAAQAERDAAWALREERWAEQNAELQRRKREDKERQQRWAELETRWAAYSQQLAAERARNAAKRNGERGSEDRAAEAGRCQTLISDAVTKGRILFKTSSAELDKRSAPTLDALAKIANACPSARIEIAGHTDSDGNDGFNKQLSERRAQSVVAYLAGAGVEKARLTAIGYGEARPIATNNSAANKAKNRRIEFTVTAN